MVLHGYFRSSSAYRVRIALNLKGLACEHRAVHLNRDGGQQFGAAFRSLNPQATVPVLEDGKAVISQSLAIIEYLDERHPETRLLPVDLVERAWVRQFALTIACDLHPLNNLRVLKYLTGTMALEETAKSQWIRHWNERVLAGLEAALEARPKPGSFCAGERPTMADCCLVPQLLNARRVGVDLDPYPRLRGIDAHCRALDAFARAHPDCQPDRE